MEKFSKAQLARQYRDKYGPEMPNAKLARIMYEENKLEFKSVERALDALRYIEGKRSKKSFKRMKDPAKLAYFTPQRSTNPYALPASDESDYTPFHIKGHKKIGILSDIHVPYHSISAITLAMDFLKKEKIDALILNGDTLDCHKLSRYIRDPRQRDFKLELDCFKAMIEIFQKELNCKIYFKVGNHEERYDNFLKEKAHELKGVEEFELENIIKARANGIDFISDKRVLVANDLHIIHGHEYVGNGSSVNPARSLLLKGHTYACHGHNHQTHEYFENKLDGKTLCTWSIGCLSELHPAYMPLNKWNHGFAVVALDDNGHDFIFQNKRIFNGKVL